LRISDDRAAVLFSQHGRQQIQPADDFAKLALKAQVVLLVIDLVSQQLGLARLPRAPA
jgi:hypothetical protein